MKGAVVKNGVIVNVISVGAVGQLGTLPMPDNLWIGDRYHAEYTPMELAQQEVTDKELSIIELGQAMTELELSDVAQGQAYTDLELMILGGKSDV